jgi:hypothetical protein
VDVRQREDEALLLGGVAKDVDAGVLQLDRHDLQGKRGVGGGWRMVWLES